MKRIGLVLAVCAMLAVSGCSKDSYGVCLKASADIATGVSQGMQTVDALRQQGVITAAEESSSLDYLKFVNDGDKAFLACAQAAHTSGSKAGSFTACATIFNSSLNNPQEMALIHVANPNAQATISNIVQAVVTGVNLVLSTLGGK